MSLKAKVNGSNPAWNIFVFFMEVNGSNPAWNIFFVFFHGFFFSLLPLIIVAKVCTLCIVTGDISKLYNIIVAAIYFSY